MASVPVWAKLTPATSDIALEAAAVFRGGADAVSSANTFPSLPLIDPETLEFEMNVDGQVSPGGLGGPAILPLSLAKMAQMTQAFPEKAFSGIGGISEFSDALNYFLLDAAPCRSAPPPCSTRPSDRHQTLNAGYEAFLEKQASRGWTTLEDFRGLLRDRVVLHSRIRRPDSDYQGGHDAHEGYAAPDLDDDRLTHSPRRLACPPH